LDLEQYLYQNIPLSQAIGIIVEEATLQKVILKAPLAPNINHKKTAFGGSLHAVATLACWSLIFINLQATPFASMEIVITASEIQYLMPVAADFFIECSFPDEARWNACELPPLN
jgi:thioesterase domain-containing protein